MKKRFLGVLLLFLLAAAPLTAGAYENAYVRLNGTFLTFDQQPIIVNDRTMVPMRKIFEAMGCEVQWDEATEKIEVWQGKDNIMTLWVGDTRMWTPKGFVQLDVTPFVMNDRTLVPLRAISESIGAKVEWDENSWTVTISYTRPKPVNQPEQEEAPSYPASCSHEDVEKIINADSMTYINTGSPATHIFRQTVTYYCKDCGEAVYSDNEETIGTHSFEGNVCEYCGYTMESSPSVPPYSDDINEITPQRSSSSGSISDYADGAFMNITVPSGMSICVPNTSGKSLSIKANGVYNVFTRAKDGDVSAAGFNNKNKSGSISIPKDGEAVIENFGNNDLTVSVPSEYAIYNVTSEKVYETVMLSRSKSVRIKPINNQGGYFYVEDANYNCVRYKPNKEEIGTAYINYKNNLSISKDDEIIIHANNDFELHYCPALLSCAASTDSGFREITVSDGQTIRITASDNSKMILYTNGDQKYDYVVYNVNGVSGNPKQGIKNKNQTISKSCFADLTNTSGSAMTVYVTDIYGNIEYR